MNERQIVHTVLKMRGIKDESRFLNPSEADLIPLNSFDNIDAAAQTVKNAIENNDHITVFFDTDTDGCTAGTIMFRYILSQGYYNVSYIINEGKKHGLSGQNISEISKGLVIIVDSIDENFDLYFELLKQHSVVILDHHIVPKDFPENILLVTSARNYDNPHLSGAGVAWKFCCYLDNILGTDLAYDLIDLAAVGIIADMCNVGEDSPENRYICDVGLSNITNIGIKAINGKYDFDSQSVSFGIAPLVNAANRTNNNDLAVKLLLCNDPKEAKELVDLLKCCKEEQNQEIEKIIPIAFEQMDKQAKDNVGFVFVDSDLEIAGLLANKLIETYQKPAIVLRKNPVIDSDTGEIKRFDFSGSCRAIGFENFKEIVDQIGIVYTGGHENAFGIGIHDYDYPVFVASLKEMVRGYTLKTVYDVDFEISSEEITDNLIDQIKKLNRISGSGFKPITVMVNGITDYEIGHLSNGRHLKIESDDILFIKWNYKGDEDEFDNILFSPELSFVGTLDRGFFGRKYNKRLIINDYKIKNGMYS